ncbi:protein-tyrosine phosphatase family protein [Sulfolobus acidocaldarius]|uniref:Conserved Archaeal protein n=4 Tax=Sulfolobus acidocaldarius TaxID=2285 RepID=Q4JB88_SULAC|nr:dual specificity protein phosphatase family protein [Sulfolobus acidocaldarius]AAY79941.1 conserved Archaeal protein [Sulfolobus acidocaldarius DSM 639]AGE70511.1 hypothetical protein SacN8_02665 [Sulfolobus acidocaldarius N8]AGE72784.1 hypothetical protein SacRon12I_02655 [Sulfolobus acidocaldarius Ron12/I]ALU29125.1 protein phosphatase [Sulfolobus acidocaldarius]ALU31851.1 protein phosphatase [Sulfolobus acidocaldarius]
MYWVKKHVIGGSAIPYTQDEIIGWINEGVKRVLVLPEEFEIDEAWGSLEYYISVLKSFNIEYLYSPIPDGRAPSENQFLEIYKWLRKDKGNLVHCVGGIGRTGTILASYLVLEENMSAEEAIEEVRRVRPGAVQTYEQELFVFKVEKMKDKWKIL